MKILHFFLASIAMWLLCACGGPSVPQDARMVNAKPTIFPDYTDVTIPANICPMNFMVSDADEVVARLTAGGISHTYGKQNKVIIDQDEWAELLQAARGKSITVELWAKRGGEWAQYKPFAMNVAPDTIDHYLSYRLIEPSYVSYEELHIEQRDLTSFEASDIYNNLMVQTEREAQCINCHSYQNYGTQRMLFHMRESHGGTMVYDDGQLKKVDLKTDSTISAGVYPAWHPTLDLVAFSTNATRQMFYSKSHEKVEVVDMESDLILYDVKNNTVSNIAASPYEMESFPAWSPDGRTLYYCSALFYLTSDNPDDGRELRDRHEDIKYNLYARSFDPQTQQFGEPRLVFDAAAMGKSVTQPRLSPDGQSVVFSLAAYGCFHVWHPDADIWLLDLKNGEAQPLAALNSKRSESYPSFSSNGRWILTASRRDDNNYTRPYISYYDPQGRCHKAFELPQRDPERYTLMLKSFNRPEFMREKVRTNPRTLAEKALEEPQSVTFKSTK